MLQASDRISMSKYSGLYLWKRDSGKKTGRLAEFRVSVWRWVKEFAAVPCNKPAFSSLKGI